MWTDDLSGKICDVFEHLRKRLFDKDIKFTIFNKLSSSLDFI